MENLIATVIVTVIAFFVGKYAAKAKEKKLETKPLKVEKTDTRFSIEFYPLTKRYYPKYESYYLQRRHNTGIVEKLESYLFTYADYGKTEKEAEQIISLFKEQQLKENVVVIQK